MLLQRLTTSVQRIPNETWIFPINRRDVDNLEFIKLTIHVAVLSTLPCYRIFLRVSIRGDHFLLQPHRSEGVDDERDA